ncbi:unknown [Clostridium sp. CAG:678]|nr:unknown [Clostridium sp. CAG:678]
MNMVFIKVGGHDNLKPITPHFLCQFQSDFVCLLWCNLIRLKALIPVPSDISVVLSVLFFGEYHLLQSNLF